MIYYVYQLDTGYTKYEHPTYSSAEIEAERLAQLHPGKVFAILAKVSQCVKKTVEWERFNDPPF